MSGVESKSMEMSSSDFPFSGDPQGGPTIYIDGMQGAFNLNGVIKLGLYQLVLDPSSNGVDGVSRQAVGRLVLSQSALAGIHQWLGVILADMQADTARADVDK